MSTKTKCHRSWDQTIRAGYDIFSAVISVLDITTDIIMMVEFHAKDRMNFFYASLTIILITQLSYCVAFCARYDKDQIFGKSCCWFFITLLPLSPLLPFVFYFAAYRDSLLFKFIEKAFETCYISIDIDNTQNNDNNLQSFGKWTENNWYQHIGFIIEALFEALPQSVLQLIAIVHFNEISHIALLSILISLISVSAKSFILSILMSMNWKTTLFNWICFITDFFAIICTLSFVFYTPSFPIDATPFLIVGQIWFYKLLLTVAPFAVIASIGINIYWSYTVIHEQWFLCCCMLLLLQIVWTLALCITVIVMEFMCYMLFAVIITETGFAKRIDNFSRQFYMDILRFITSNQAVNNSSINDELLITKKQDQIIRIACVNHVLCMNDKDANLVYLKKYLTDHSAVDQNRKYPFCDVVLDEMMLHSFKDPKHSMKRVMKKAEEHINRILFSINGGRDLHEWFSWILIYILVPLYFIGRICTSFYPLFIVLVLFIGYDFDIFTAGSVAMFQACLFVLYALLVIVFLILLFRNILPEENVASYILPTKPKLDLFSERNLKHYLATHSSTEPIDEYYAYIIGLPLVQHLCEQKFGTDIAFIILLYFQSHTNCFRYNILPYDDDMDHHVTKLLLLGAGNTGKTTLFKQFRREYGSSYTDTELMQWKLVIIDQIIEEMKYLLELLEDMVTEEKTSEFELSVDAQNAAGVLNVLQRPSALTPAVVDAIECLWNEPALKFVFSSNTTAAISDSCVYFWDNIRNISQPDYVPSEADILLTYKVTTGIVEQQLHVGSQTIIKIVDTGGQLCERRKWIHCFANVTVVMFVVSLCHYNEYLMEDSIKNAMQDSIELFTEIVNSRWFTNTTFVLLLNKKDLFEERIQTIPITQSSCDALHDFDGDTTDFDQVTTFIRNVFEDCNQNTTKQIYTHLCCATDTHGFTMVFNDIQHAIITASLVRGGLI